MSREHADAFLDTIEEDSDLYKRMSVIRDRMQAETMRLAQEYGFELTPYELKTALENKLGAKIPGPDEEGDDPSTCVLPFSEAPGR